MLRTLILKEFLDNLQNLRFLAGLLLSVLLTILCLILQTQSYGRRIQDYREDTRVQDEQIAKVGPTSGYFRETPLVPPEALSPVAIGLHMGHTSSFDANFLPELFRPLDIVFIVTIIMSLLGILFSYDSICGERESGTLKLMCSNSLPRTTLIFGKWLGGAASLLLPFMISVLLGAVYITSNPAVHWNATDWLAFTALALASAVFISMFYLLGMMVSALSRSSSAAILKALLLWVLIVLVIPNLGPFISTQIYPISSLSRFKKEEHDLSKKLEKDGEFMKQYTAMQTELDRRYEKQYGDMFREYKAIPRGKVLERTGMEAPESEIKQMGLAYRRESRDISEKIMQPIIDSRKKLREKIILEGKRQTEIAKNIAAISPCADYLYLAADLAATGFGNKNYLDRQMTEYSEIASKYGEKKSEEKDRKKISDWRNMKNSPLDLSDRPRFVYRNQPFTERLKSALPYGAVLLVCNVLFFAGAYVAFLRYDVR